MADAVETLINTYHELNASVVDELFDEPSPLEFMRYVAQNRPFIGRGTASEWTAVRKWHSAYMREALGTSPVNIAITPKGNADAVIELDGSLYFVEPHEQTEQFDRFLDYVQDDARISNSERSERSVKYAQTQNDNLRDEYRNLFDDVPSDISFARIALDAEPDAVNLWIGNGRSVTALHKDNYENIYVQIRGQKHFVLLAPVEMPCVNEQSLPQVRYEPNPEGDERLVIKMNDDVERIPVAVWDPHEPEKRASPYSKLANPLRITLNEGDMLYLPAMWYHKVSQTAGKEGFACAVNYWYDMSFTGPFWSTNNFIRDVVSENKARDSNANGDL